MTKQKQTILPLMMFYILFLESISGHGSFCVRGFIGLLYIKHSDHTT